MGVRDGGAAGERREVIPDFDFTWKNPTQAQLDALAHAARSFGYSVNKTVNIPAPLTHHLVMSIEANRKAMAVDADQFNYGLSIYDFAEIILTAFGSLWYAVAKSKDDKSMQTITAIVERGYESGEWWDASALWPDKTELENRYIHIMTVPMYPNLVSAAFRYLPHLMIPRHKRKHIRELTNQRLKNMIELVKGVAGDENV